MTSEPVTEPSVASGVVFESGFTAMDTDILNALISAQLCSSVVESTAIAGRLKSEIAARVDCLLDYLWSQEVATVRQQRSSEHFIQ